MVIVEDTPCLGDVELVGGALVPGHVEHPVQVVPDPSSLRVLVTGPLQAVELALNLFADGFRHACFVDLLAVVGGDVRIALAELLLDGVHLLT